MSLYFVPGSRRNECPHEVGTRGALLSCNYLMHHAPCDIGEAKIAASVAVGQPLMVESKQMEDCGMEVVDVDLVGRHTAPIIVAFAIAETPPNAAARHPRGEHFGVMLSAPCVPARVERGAAKFRRPYYQGFVQHTPALEVLEQP